MEDDNGLELSLGLSWGASSGQSKIKEAPSDPKFDEGNSNRLARGNMTGSDSSFKNFFHKVTETQDQKGKQKTLPDSHQLENFFTDLGKGTAVVTDHSSTEQNNLSQLNRYQELWASNTKKTDAEDEKSNKRKMPFEDKQFQNKHERNSHATEDASSGVAASNEDVAESEAEGSNFWLLSNREDKSKISDVPKFTDKGMKESSLSVNESNQGLGKAAYGIPMSLHPLTVMPVPYPVPVKLPASANVTGFPSSCMMQLMPIANGEHQAIQGMNMSNTQLSFGYSPIQLPTLETGSSWAFNSLPRPVASRVNGDGAANTERSDDLKSSNGYDGKSIDSVKAKEKHDGENIASASQHEDNGKGISTILRQNEAAHQPPTVQNISMIMPGIASDVKFGGSGSHPDLPWVSTTGPGPNGKTISGVTYKFNQNEVKIVCACHGIHMSPEEFVRHATGDTIGPEDNTKLTTAASAKS